MNCQIVHDSLHRRPGWTRTYLLECDDKAAGFGSIAIAGPWKNKPTLFEFYLLPKFRDRAFALFDALLTASGARFMEIQSNDALLAVMFHAYARQIESEKIVFRDGSKTKLRANGAGLRCETSLREIRSQIKARQGGPHWLLEVDGKVAGNGGILFHYNLPYGDIYMEVAEPYRRRGFGAWIVQEIKHAAYELGVIPGARCNTTNIASRQTLQKAGFVPFAHMLIGALP